MNVAVVTVALKKNVCCSGLKNWYARKVMEMIYKVTIEETVAETFEIEVAEGEDAIEVATAKYKDGELVLEPGELIYTQMMAESIDGSEITSWVEV